MTKYVNPNQYYDLESYDSSIYLENHQGTVWEKRGIWWGDSSGNSYNTGIYERSNDELVIESNGLDLIIGSSTGIQKINFGSSPSDASYGITLTTDSSGSLIFAGNAGNLFSITDNLVGSLMSISAADGIPIFEVFSTDRIEMGEFGTYALIVDASRVAIGQQYASESLDVSGNIRLATIPTTGTSNDILIRNSTSGNIESRTMTSIINDISLNNILDVSSLIPSVGSMLYYDGVNWIDTNNGLTWDGNNLGLNITLSTSAGMLFDTNEELFSIWSNSNIDGMYIANGSIGTQSGILLKSDGYITMPQGLGINGATAVSAIPLNVSLASDGSESIKLGEILIKTLSGGNSTLDAVSNAGAFKITINDANFDETSLLLYGVRHPTVAGAFYLGNVTGTVDIDVPAGNSKIFGASAFASATTLLNSHGGNIILGAGAGSSGTGSFAGNGGDIIIDGGTKSATGLDGNILLSSIRGRTLIGDVTNQDASSILQVSPDTDASIILGRSKIVSYVSDRSFFSHIDMDQNSYALSQTNNGQTIINSKATQTLILATGNSVQWTISSEGDLKGSGGNDLWVSQDISVGRQILLDNGSTSAPALSFSNDSNTGFYWSADGFINYVSNGVSQIRFGNSLLPSSTNGIMSLGGASNRWGSVFITGINTGITVGDSVKLQARNTNDGSWKVFATLTANVTPSFLIDGSTRAVTQSINDNTTALATTAYVDTAGGSFLPLIGGTLTGPLTITGGGFNIGSIGTPLDSSFYSNVYIHNDLTVGGDLTIDGSLLIISSETIDVSAAFIYLNTGAVGSVPSSMQSGIIIDRGDASLKYVMIYDESTQEMRIGFANETSTGFLDSSTMVVATREDYPFDNGIAIWDNNNNKFKTDPSLSYLQNGDLLVSPDTDTTHVLGRIKLDSRNSDSAYFSHYDMDATDQYAIAQLFSGVTNINSPQYIQFAIGTNLAWTINATKDLVGSNNNSLTVDGSIFIITPPESGNSTSILIWNSVTKAIEQRTISSLGGDFWNVSGLTTVTDPVINGNVKFNADVSVNGTVFVSGTSGYFSLHSSSSSIVSSPTYSTILSKNRLSTQDNLTIDSVNGNITLFVAGSIPGMVIDTSGNIFMSDASIFNVAPNTNSSIVLGRTRIDTRISDWTTISHYNMSGLSEYALIQSSNGATSINSASGQGLNISLGGASQWVFGSSGDMIGGTGNSLTIHSDVSILSDGDLYVDSSIILTNFPITGTSNNILIRNDISGTIETRTIASLSGDIDLNDINDVSTGTTSQWDMLYYDGINWIDSSGNMSFDGTTFSATAKSFRIKHPITENSTYKYLQYGSVESNEHSVLVRGKIDNKNIIELPDYWTKLVYEDSITVQLTSRTSWNYVYVKDIVNNKVIIGKVGFGKIKAFYTVNAERKDIPKLKVEY